MAKQKPPTTKQPERKPVKIPGAFVHRTFIDKAKVSGYSESEAIALFESMLNDGRVVAAVKIGLLNESNKYAMK